MKPELVKCERCGNYNDITDVMSLETYASNNTDAPVFIICDKCGYRICQ